MNGPATRPPTDPPSRELEQAVTAALVAMARLSRSLSLYDPRNQAVRGFLQELRDRSLEAVRHGAVTLRVRPFELLLDERVVYLERDRERSIAFLLFRDGVRELTLEPEVGWGEILALVEILATQFAGVGRGEEDLVTLIYKAGLKHVRIKAVQGFVQDQEDTGGGAGAESEATRQARKDAGSLEVPRGWDLPLPELPRPATVAYRAVNPQHIEALLAETDPARLPHDGLRLATELLRAAIDPVDPTAPADVLPFLASLRDFLSGEGAVKEALLLLQFLNRAKPLDPPAFEAVIAGFSGEGLVASLMDRAAATRGASPELVRERIETIPGDPLDGVLKAMAEPHAPEGRRRLGVRLLATWLPEARPRLEPLLEGEDGRLASDVLRALALVLKEERLTLAIKAASREEPEVQEVVALILKRIEPTARDRARLLDLLDSPDLDVRLMVLELMGRSADPGAFSALRGRLERRAGSDLPAEEAEALGRALARLDSEVAAPVFTEWIKPSSLWKRLSRLDVDPVLGVAAVSGLAEISITDHAPLIRWLAQRAGGDLRDHCLRTLVRGGRGEASA